MRSMIAAQAWHMRRSEQCGGAERCMPRSTQVREEAQRADDHWVRINEALDMLRRTELRQVGYKTVL
jgi:hypothetical protein